MEKTLPEPTQQQQQQQQQAPTQSLPSSAALAAAAAAAGVSRKPVPALSSSDNKTTTAAAGTTVATTSKETEKEKAPELIHSDTGDSSTILVSEHIENKEPAGAATGTTTATATAGTKTEKALPNPSSSTKPLPSAPLGSSQGSILRRLYTRHYKARPRRIRILILSVLLLLLILVVVLSTVIPLTHRSKFSHLPLPSNHGGPYTGDLTYYEPGLGACGIDSSSSDYIVAISHTVFDAAAAAAGSGSNPNKNPLCGLKVRAERNGKSVDLTVVDRCVGCQPDDLDTTTTVFAGLAEISQGRVGVSWAWLQNVPS